MNHLELKHLCSHHKGYETQIVHRSFSSQFHCELLSNLRVDVQRKPSSYAELKIDDGARLFARLLYAEIEGVFSEDGFAIA